MSIRMILQSKTAHDGRDRQCRQRISIVPHFEGEHRTTHCGLNRHTHCANKPQILSQCADGSVFFEEYAIENKLDGLGMGFYATRQ